LPIGGVARLERMPEKPKEELAVALAGPAINVCLALLLFAVITAGIQITELANLNFVGGRFLVNLMWANVFLAVFNMVPAFPMDGGRVLRALLATRLNYVLATRAAAYIGQGLAIVFAILGLIYRNPFWVFIAMFVYMGAAAEARQVELKSALKGVPVGRVMVRGIRNLAASSDLSTAAEELLQGWQDDFPVLEGNRVVGVLGRPDLLSALAKHGPGTRVSEVMDHEFVTATPMDPADVALLRLRSSDADMMLVMSDSELIGVVTRDSIRRFLSVASAHRRAPVRPQPQITSLTERPA
jgi:CBS domain-containing protein